MTVELTQEVSSRRLKSDRYGWLTTAAKSGQPAPRLVWFLFDDNQLTVCGQPSAAKIAHIAAHPRVSLNLDSDGNCGGVIAVGATATVDETDVDPRDNTTYWAKYAGDAAQFGLTDAIAGFSTRPKISVDRVWTAPAG